MDDDAVKRWFEGIWAEREERIYRAFFGDLGPGIYAIPARTFQSLGCEDPDPRYLTHGVFECPPHGEREHWLYVSSGMSNPWGESPATVDPRNFSGLGFEFTLHAPERGRWPIQLLHWVMAVQLLVAGGQLQGNLLERGDRIPLGGALAKKEGLLTQVLVAAPLAEDYPAGFDLASGKVEFMLLLGITQREADFAASQGAGGGEALVDLLRHRGIFPVTDPGRQGAL
jgi:hypothetical protein